MVKAKTPSKKAAPALSSGKSWTETEDAALLAAAKAAGVSSSKPTGADWAAVAAKVGGGRSAAACLGRWMTKAAPADAVTRGGWTAAEDAALLAMVGDPATPSWATRAVALGARFHNGVRRGGAETCARYFALKKQQGKQPPGPTPSAKKPTSSIAMRQKKAKSALPKPVVTKKVSKAKQPSPPRKAQKAKK